MSKIDMKRDGEKRFRSKMNRKHWRDYRLRELEKQLEFAESRCGTLKQQLDYIKVLYGCGKPSFHENDEVSEPYEKEENRSSQTGMRRISFDDLSRWNVVAGDLAGGDNTEKVFLPQTVSYTNTTRVSTNSSNKAISSKSSFDKKEIMENNSKEIVPQKCRVKLTKGKRKKSMNNSKHKLKIKGSEPQFNNATSQTLWPTWQDPVVEIYKNTSANIESESAADVSYHNKRQKLDNHKTESSKTIPSRNRKPGEANEQLIPATKLRAFTSFKSLEKVHIVKEESVQTESVTENDGINSRNDKPASADTLPKPSLNSEKTLYEPEPVKSYCQPTISSKKKRVERNFLTNLNSLNLKNIPFIAATSTAPSHNIGVNIQQVLSIIKKKQPNANPEIMPILSDQLIGDIAGQFSLSSKVIANDTNEGEANRGDLAPELSLLDLKKHSDGSKSTASDKKISDRGLSCKIKSQEDVTGEIESPDWTCKVHKLKKVLVFLHEDFTSLSQKYKRLQKKLSKRNINKIDAKGELAEIERDLEKKEEEITIVIGLYKEVLHLREEVKKYQEKFNLVAYERALMLDGIKQSNSTHTQMSTLLRKIQQFQDQLKR